MSGSFDALQPVLDEHAAIESRLADPAVHGDPAEGPLIGTTRPVRARPGRARFVTRERTAVVQTAWIERESMPTLLDTVIEST